MRKKFPLTSDQLELLIAFSETKSLSQLADLMVKDQSVVSRGLQKIGETLPVIEKVGGRWKITQLGNQIIENTVQYIENIQGITKTQLSFKNSPQPYIQKSASLIVINAQKALLDSSLGKSSNSKAVENIFKILTAFRETGNPIFHIKHISQNPKSRFYSTNDGSHIISSLLPKENEAVIEKSKSSAFVDTNLNEMLDQIKSTEAILVGFTANDCIDATARNASELGLNTFVVGDATASFDISTVDGKVYDAARVHDLTLANINALYAKVIFTKEILDK